LEEELVEVKQAEDRFKDEMKTLRKAVTDRISEMNTVVNKWKENRMKEIEDFEKEHLQKINVKKINMTSHLDKIKSELQSIDNISQGDDMKVVVKKAAILQGLEVSYWGTLYSHTTGLRGQLLGYSI
jgi:hypothetical protein